MKGVSFSVQKNPAVLVGRPGLNKREECYEKFKAE
jgi:hypothetical protein